MATSATVKVTVVGDSTSLESALDKAASKTTSTAGHMKTAFSGALSQINSAGVLGPFGAALDGVGGTIDALGEKHTSLGGKMMATGAIGTGVGAALVGAAKGDEAAQAQLKQAIDNTGGSYGDYKDQIDKVISTQEKYGHTASDTQTALGNLTTSTGSVEKATDLMGVTSDLAAKRHLSLADASDMVTKIFEGKGGKALSNLGITMDTSIKDPSERGQKALDELGKRLSGDASASADTFGGKLDSIKAKVEDSAASLGQKYGPALMGASAALGIAGTAMEALSGFEAAEAIASLAAFWWVIPIIAAVALVGVAIYELYTHWDTVWAAIKSAVDVAWGFIQQIFHAIVDFGIAYIKTEINIAKDVWNAVWNAISGTISGVWNNVIKPVFDFFKNTISDAFLGAQIVYHQYLEPVFHWIGDRFNDFMAGIQEVGAIWNSIWSGIQDAVNSAWNFICGIFDSIKNGVNDVINGIKSIPGVSSVMSFLGNSAGDTYSMGGPRLVGEHGPELVQMPAGAKVIGASGTADAMSGSGSTTNYGGASINLTVNAGIGTDGYEVGQQIVTALAKFTQSGGRIPAALVGS